MLFNDRYIEVNKYPDGFVYPRRKYQDLARFSALRGDFGPGEADALVASQVGAISQLLRDKKGSFRQQRRLPDGRVVETLVTALPTGGFVKTYEDITERVRSEAERAQLTEKYHAAQKTQFASAHARLNEFDQAEVNIEKALKLNPRMGSAHAVMGYIELQGKRDIVSAQKQFQEAMALEPTNDSVRDLMGVALYQEGRYSEAIRYFEDALRINPNNTQAILLQTGFVHAAALCNFNLQSTSLVDEPVSTRTAGSSEDVGSSAMIASGPMDRARAMATR